MTKRFKLFLPGLLLLLVGILFSFVTSKKGSSEKNDIDHSKEQVSDHAVLNSNFDEFK